MKKTTQVDWLIKSTAGDVAQFACDTIMRCAAQSIEQRGVFKIVLAGGTTPEKVYTLLANEPCDWQHWQLYLGDERCLPVADPQRNSMMVQRTLLDNPNVSIPAKNCHFIPAEQGAKQAVKAYQSTVESAVPFDLVMLGMGEDGHTASLFPGMEYPEDDWVHAVYDSPKPPAERVSLSVKALSQNKMLLIMVTGLSKQAAVHRWRNGDTLPVAQIGSLGQVNIVLDNDAAQ